MVAPSERGVKVEQIVTDKEAAVNGAYLALVRTIFSRPLTVNPDQLHVVRETLDSLMQDLSSREGRKKSLAVVQQRFGLTGEGPKTRTQIGSSFHVGSERVRNLENKGIAMLRYQVYNKSKLIDVLSSTNDFGSMDLFPNTPQTAERIRELSRI